MKILYSLLILLFICSPSYAKRLDEMNANTSPDITNDLIYSQDVSDTTENSHGTGKSLTIKNLLKAGKITVDGTNVGINTVSPSSQLQVVGTVRATSFVGDGSGLTGVSGSSTISDTVYGASWDGDTTTGASKNALYDKIETLGSASISDSVYGASWDGDTTVAPSKNAVYDKIETIGSTSGGWTDGGTNVYTTASTDNVGVGTLAPAYKLEVKGPIGLNGEGVNNAMNYAGLWKQFSSQPIGPGGSNFDYLWMRPTTTNAPMRLGLMPNGTVSGTANSMIAGIKIFQTSDIDDLTDSCDVGMYMTSSGFRINTKHNGSCPSFPIHFGHQDTIIDMTLDNTGNLGIGTITPTARLTLHGAGTGATPIQNWKDSAGSQKVVILNNGTVGIGTAAPGRPLDVVGVVKATSFEGDGSALTGISGGGGVGIGTTNTVAYWNSTSTIGSLPTGTYPTLTELSYVKGATSSLQEQIDGLGVGVGGWTDGGTNVYVSLTTDNVAIGTTTPTTRLTVIGTVTATAFVGDGSALTGISGGTGGWTDSGTNIYNTTTTDNVGIGTTIPSSNLMIRSATSTGLKIVNSAGGASGGAGIQAISDDNAAAVLGDRLGFYTFGGSADSADGIVNGAAISGYADGTFTTSSAPSELRLEVAPSGSTTRAVALVADSTSNVGIGTTTPQTKLQVVGTVSATTFSGAGTGLTGTAASLTAGNVTTNANLTGDVTSSGNATTLISTYKGWTDGGTNIYPTLTSDQVAIGTTTPAGTNALTVRGTIGGSGTGPIVLSDANVGIGTTTAPALLTVGSTGSFQIDTSGNTRVGIGTTTAGTIICVKSISSGTAVLGYCTGSLTNSICGTCN